MTNTALRAGLPSDSGICLATAEAERRPRSANNTHMVLQAGNMKSFIMRNWNRRRRENAENFQNSFVKG